MYIDLNLVWADPRLKARYGSQNTLVISPDHEKVQLIQKNSIVPPPYQLNDVGCKKDTVSEHTPEWHEQHMYNLAKFVAKLTAECADVPSFLSQNNDFRPNNLLE
jgi:hypothetical protein